MFSLSRQLKRPRRRRNQRRGGAIVETAFCIPLVILLMLGTLEVCSAIYLRESLKVAAFEGIRVGIRKGGTPQDIQDRANAVLQSRGITIPNNGQFGVKITPADFNNIQALEPVTVQVIAPTQGNSAFIFNSFLNRRVAAHVTMVREFDD